MSGSYRFTLRECRQLSARAWQIRRFHAGRLAVPLLSVSWKECLLLAKKEQVRRQVWEAHTAVIQLFPRPVVQPLVGVGSSVFLPAQSRPVRRSGWASGFARAASVLLLLAI